LQILVDKNTQALGLRVTGTRLLASECIAVAVLARSSALLLSYPVRESARPLAFYLVKPLQLPSLSSLQVLDTCLGFGVPVAGYVGCGYSADLDVRNVASKSTHVDGSPTVILPTDDGA
jgi:hypothetical protein